MEKRTDKNSYTLLFATAMVIVIGSLLAFIASSLKSKIDENKRIEKQQNILYAMGVHENGNGNSTVAFIEASNVAGEFSKYIKKQIVITDLDIVENNDAYLIDIKKEQTKAKAGGKRQLPLFIGKKDGKTYYIVPIRGIGLWDAIWAYVAMDENMTIQGAYFDHQAETAGLGANIKQRFFMDDFIGEKLLDDNGIFKGITVSKSNSDPKNDDKNDNEVDAIAGATITGDGVSAMIKSDLRLYQPYFENLKKTN
jgi:Na+-transporting NADH:ubiquinone oxidoreductase subunit C